MNEQRTLQPREKALAVNLDTARYGTFAEIGAGQEVVRWFFRVGAAAGTVAKSISAYDMEVSDAIYGPCERYVCRERLEDMLDYEFALNLERLREGRGEDTAFFACADTVKARGYRGTDECHAWMGVKFQAAPRAERSQDVLHTRLLDSTAAQQQAALGLLGVNLLHGAFYHTSSPRRLIESLLEGLSVSRIEVDMIELSGPAFADVDNRVMSLQLVQLGLSTAAMFSADGVVLQPSEVLRKRSALVARGSFRPVTHVNVDMIEQGLEVFREDLDDEEPIVVAEITMRNLRAEGSIDLNDFLARADVLASTGYTVLISDCFEYYRLAQYLRTFTNEKIALVLGVSSLLQIFDESYYADLDGGILESFGRLFRNELRLYVYPMLDPDTGALITADNLEVPASLRGLYEYLREARDVIPLRRYREEVLRIFSPDVRRRIAEQDASWREMVPASVAAIIEERGLFGYEKDP